MYVFYRVFVWVDIRGARLFSLLSHEHNNIRIYQNVVKHIQEWYVYIIIWHLFGFGLALGKLFI